MSINRTSINWAKYDAFLGLDSDSEVAKTIGCSPASVRKRRKKLGIKVYAHQSKNAVDWNNWDHLLGKISDVELAERIGCKSGQVQSRRKKKNIGSKRKIDWSKFDHLLGTMSDANLAKKIGCSTSSVANRRRKKGLKPFGPMSLRKQFDNKKMPEKDIDLDFSKLFCK